jgi:hypothetical protein
MRLWLSLLLCLPFLGCGAELHYRLEFSLTQAGAVRGEAVVSGVAEGPLSELVFRLYPAALDPTYLWITEVSQTGQPLAWDQVHPTTLVVPMELRAGQTFSVRLQFQGQLPPLPATAGYGIYARSPQAMVLAQAYPVLAPWEEGEWWVRPVLRWGDALVAEVADYTVQVQLPPGWEVVATGVEEKLGPGEFSVRGENLREFLFVALRGYQTASQTWGGVEVESWFLPSHREAGKAAARISGQAVVLYQELFCPYPFPELEVVEVPLKDAAGVEYPGLILGGESYYARYPEGEEFFAEIFAHEVAHQWWYALVGNDQVQEPWLDEALATYSSGCYLVAHGGDWEELIQWWELAYERASQHNPEAMISDPLEKFPAGIGYGGIVYRGGAVFFHQLRQLMGDEPFFRALRRYAETYAWQLARGEDLLAILQEESPVSLRELCLTWLGEGSYAGAGTKGGDGRR